MGITFHEKTSTFHLTNAMMSYMIKVSKAGHLVHLYWGKALHVSHLEYALETKAYSTYLPDETDFEHVQLEGLPQEFPSFGNNDLRLPAIELAFENGSRICDFRYRTHTIYQGKKKLSGLPATYVVNDEEATTLDIVLEDPLMKLSLTLTYTIYEERSVITRSANIENKSTKPIAIHRMLSCSVDFTDEEFDFIHLSGAWATERHIKRTPLRAGSQSISSRRGASSHGQNPFIALAHKDCDEFHGDVYAFSFVYSGNFLAEVEMDVYHRIRAQMGINPFDFCWQLAPKEHFQTPEVVMVYASEGLNQMSQTFHALFANRLIRGNYQYANRPILMNNWEATYFDFDEQKILEIAKAAQPLGIELFVLDDGWFGNRNSDTTSLGDWVVNEEKLKGGLKSLATAIENMGMKFGLWFEPEMISPESMLYKLHPDWCIHVPNRHRSLVRTQCVLDLSRIDVCNYIIDMMSKTLASAPISYVKWDYNRNFSEVYSTKLPHNRQRELPHRYMLNLYAIVETLTQKFPDVLFESCAGGGGRFDAGMLYYMPQTWTSDDTDAIERLKIQFGTSLVYPPACMSCHVSASPNHQVQRATSLKTRGITAMSGNFGYELDITKLTQSELMQISEQTTLYKRIRESVQYGKLTRLLSPFDGNEAAWMYTSKDEKEIVVNYVRPYATPYPLVTTLKLHGLDEMSTYQVLGDSNLYLGAELMYVGLIIPELHGDYDSAQWILQKV